MSMALFHIELQKLNSGVGTRALSDSSTDLKQLLVVDISNGGIQDSKGLVCSPSILDHEVYKR